MTSVWSGSVVLFGSDFSHTAPAASAMTRRTLAAGLVPVTAVTVHPSKKGPCTLRRAKESVNLNEYCASRFASL